MSYFQQHFIERFLPARVRQVPGQATDCRLSKSSTGLGKAGLRTFLPTKTCRHADR